MGLLSHGMIHNFKLNNNIKLTAVKIINGTVKFIIKQIFFVIFRLSFTGSIFEKNFPKKC